MPPENTSPWGITDRVVRVFVSSTFRDMHKEREELVKRIFPRLRKLCDQRGVTWGEVDLRWGITDEQVAEGKMLPICLAEIERCRPFFIGLLGERYGTVPEEETLPSWLTKHRGKSVTELEIIHGVLDNPAMANRACFYFRDPAYLNSLPASVRADFVESAPELRDKLAALKAEICKSDLPVREDYPDPETLGRMVLEDLTVAITQMYPPESIPDPLDREAAEHEAFARHRARVYIGRQKYFERLDAHAVDDGPPLVVAGESGSGKSALLANWALRYRTLHPDDLLLMHFVGATARSTDWTAMVRRIMNELHRRLGIERSIPDDPAQLRPAFANTLHMAAARGRVILILDALNQLEDRGQALDLMWLPDAIPPAVRLLVSTTPGTLMEELERRHWLRFDVGPLRCSERRQLIDEYLQQYRKTLRADHHKLIATSPQAANPLYLRALLEELRVFGDRCTLGERIKYYLSATTIPQLFERILERYERDYERDCPGIVGHAMALIWGARRGLSEVELLELLGDRDGPLPHAYWSPLYLACESSLVNRSGLITFSHEYMRQAIKQRYVSTPEEEQAVHLDLADYFQKQESTSRKVDETPWQLAQAQCWDQLSNLLASPPFFEACWAADQFEVKRYWALVERNSPFRAVRAYRPILDDPQPQGQCVADLATLLADMGHLSEALALRSSLVEYYDRIGDEDGLQASLSNQALILKIRGRLDEAMALHERAERLCRRLGNKDGLRISLGNQAVILHARGRLAEALARHKLEEELCRELRRDDGLSVSLGNQAVVLKDMGCLDEARALLQRVERLCRESGNKEGLQTSLGNQALVLQASGKLEEALALLKQQGDLCRELGNKDGLQISLGEQANVYHAWGRLDEAMALYLEKARLARELGKKHSLGISLGNQAGILRAWNRLREAMDLLRQQEGICRGLDNQEGLATSLVNQALLLSENMGRPHEALHLANEACRIAADHGLAALARSIEGIRDSIRRATEAETEGTSAKRVPPESGTDGDGSNAAGEGSGPQ